MRSRIYIFLLGLLLGMACLGASKTASSAQVAHPISESSGYRPRQLPNKDPERIQQDVVSGVQGAVQKKISLPVLSALPGIHHPVKGIYSLSGCRTSLQKKDYLSHIYPFHNFW